MCDIFSFVYSALEEVKKEKPRLNLESQERKSVMSPRNRALGGDVVGHLPFKGGHPGPTIHGDEAKEAVLCLIPREGGQKLNSLGGGDLGA